MNSMLLNIIIQTIPKVNANLCIAAVILTDKVPVPYLGSIFFIGGFFGLIYAALWGLRGYMVYKYYYDIYKEEDLKKLDNDYSK